MLTLLDLLRRTTEYFEKKGVPKAKLDAELLIAHVMKIKRLELYLRFEKIVDEKILEELRPLVKRRGEREPLQYILGDVEWGNVKLKVDRRCLVPRNETEELWESIVAENSAAEKKEKIKAILDLGTGSGALAIALKKSFPTAAVTAVERNVETLALAKENATLNGVEINFLNGSWFEKISANEKFEMIVSNPPYLTEAEVATVKPEVAQWEPREAIWAPDEGFADIEKIIRGAKNFLAENGQLWLEMGIAHSERAKKLASQCGYKASEFFKDHNGRERFARISI